MSEFDDAVLSAVHASSDYARVMQDILARKAATWGMLSAEVGMVDLPELRRKAEADPRWNVLLSAMETRLRTEGKDPLKEQSAEPSKAENNLRTRMLKERISGSGYTDAAGVFKGVPENSFFLPGISRKALRLLAAEYGQYSYAFGVASLAPGGEPHYWFVRTADDAIEQDGNPNEDLVHLREAPGRPERNLEKGKMMEEGKPVGRLAEPGPDRSELGLRPFRLEKPPGQRQTTGLPLPDEESQPPQGKTAGHYYVLTRDASKYVGSDHVHRVGVDDAFFPGGSPDVSVIAAILPLSEEEMGLAISQRGRIRRG